MNLDFMQNVFIYSTLLIKCALFLAPFSPSFLSLFFPFLLLLHFFFSSLFSLFLLLFFFSIIFAQFASKPNSSSSLFHTHPPTASPAARLLPELHVSPATMPHSDTFTRIPLSLVPDFQLFSTTSIFCFSASPVYVSLKMSFRFILFISANSKLIHVLIT